MAKGGSRWGAGRPSHNLKESDSRAIDVRCWQREGLLRGGYFGWQWTDTDTGDVRASIGVQVGGGHVCLIYTSNEQSVRDTVNLTHTPCQYGGQRVWFECPKCHERCAKLFMRYGRFRCRKCNQIAYTSQSKDIFGRAWQAQRKIEKMLEPNWQRPKYMHHKTHMRLFQRIMELSDIRNQGMAESLERLEQKLSAIRRNNLV